MYRGTSPTFIIRLKNNPLDLNLIKELWVTIKTTKTEITKDLSDCEVDNENSVLYLKLSQEDTLSLSVGEASVQLRILMKDGTAIATPIKRIAVSNVLKEGVLK